MLARASWHMLESEKKTHTQIEHGQYKYTIQVKRVFVSLYHFREQSTQVARLNIFQLPQCCLAGKRIMIQAEVNSFLFSSSSS